MVTPLSAHFPNCRADQMPSALPHSAAKGPYAAVSPAISPVAARPAYPHCRRQRCSAGRWRRPYLRIPQLPGRPDTICSPPQRGRGPYAAVSPAISSTAAHPAYPHFRRQRRLLSAHSPNDTRREPHPANRKGLSSRRAPAHAAVLGRQRRIDLHVGGEERGAANKSRIAAEKEAGLIPQAVRLPKERHLPRATKGGAPVPRPALRRSVQNPLPFPALMQNRRGCRPTPNHLPLPSSWAASPLPPSGHGALPCPQWSAPFCRATRLPATEIMDKPGRE